MNNTPTLLIHNIFDPAIMSNFISKYKVQILFFILALIAIALPRGFFRSNGFYYVGGLLRSPLWFYLAMLIAVIIYIFIKTRLSSRKYLLKRGFIETNGEILHITEKFNLGHPKNHTVQLSMKIRVQSVTSSSFESLVKVTITERGNTALGYRVRTLDYQVGETISVMYNPKKNNKVVIPSK